jgi:hypothetical protein
MAVFPGGSQANTYVPNTDATRNMVVDFSRNVNSFPLNKYVQIVPVTKDVGYYTVMTIEEAGRILDSTLANHLWADGEEAPSDRGRTESFVFTSYNTKRYVFNFRLGKKAAEQASWDILAQHGRIKAQQAMTGRTQILVTLATTGANWGGNTIAVSSITGVTGKWDVSTTARTDIKRSINYGVEQIMKATLGGVSYDDIKLVISPGEARLISVSQEIVDYLKQSPDSLAYIRQDLGPNAAYGLPEKLYGVEVVIENTVKVTSRKGATRAASYIWADTVALLVARPGGLMAAKDSQAAPRFSALSLFMYEEMSVESKFDPDNRLEKGRVVEDFAAAVTSQLAGFLFTATTG